MLAYGYGVNKAGVGGAVVVAVVGGGLLAAWRSVAALPRLGCSSLGT